MSSVIPTFAIGAIFIPLGLTIFIHRVRVARYVANSQKRILGKALREPSPGDALGMGGVGIFMSLLGVGLVAGALVSAFSLPGGAIH
ncbi:MAG: hypothetical protein JWO18_575 [Microbacteriaceae bacterium]|nr:hypothetical protein [Microbacteriaceae bacterium]